MNARVPFHSVLIFGGAGFIGSNWAHRLITSTNARIHIFDNLSRAGVAQNLSWLKREAGAERARLKITIGDIRNPAQVARAVEGASEIYHFAAQVAVTRSVADPRFDFEVNVGGTLNVLEAARKGGYRPLILFTSTNKVYGPMKGRRLLGSARRYTCLDSAATNESQPLDFYSAYGCSKGAAEQYVHDYGRMYGIPTVVFRMSCVAGPRQFGNEEQGWVAHFLYSALQKIPITIYGDGRQVRDVLGVDDLMRAFEAVRKDVQKSGGEIYNVGGGIERAASLLEVIDEIEHMTGRRLCLTTKPTRPGDQLFYVTDFSKLERHVAWRPRLSVRQTVESIYRWGQENGCALAPLTSVEKVPLPNLQQFPGAA
jgi:CDP-paratose 2-epimerase